jgi:hypothetical protein
VRLAQDASKELRRENCFPLSELGKLEFNILWPQFPYNDLVTIQAGRNCSFAQKRRKVLGSHDHALRVVGGHFAILDRGINRFRCFFDIDQAGGLPVKAAV